MTGDLPTDIELRTALRGAPGPSPWFHDMPDAPRVVLPGGPTHWTRADGAGRAGTGKTVLRLPTGEPVLLLSFQCYTLPLANGRLLAWYTGRDQSMDPLLPDWSVEFRLFDVDAMPPLGSLAVECEAMDRASAFLRYLGEPEWSASVQMDHPERMCALDCPPPVQEHGEILLWSSTSPLDEHGDRQVTTYLIIVDPVAGSVRRVRQTWFDEGPYELPHQWLARVARHMPSGRVIGEGVRLRCFLLTPDLSSVERWL